jgi:hypothetical protein
MRSLSVGTNASGICKVTVSALLFNAIAKFLHLAITDLPIEKSNFSIDGNGGMLFGCVNNKFSTFWWMPPNRKPTFTSSDNDCIIHP